MAYRKLNINYDQINQCRYLAAKIIKPIHKYIERHSSLSIESATLSILGFKSADLIITRLGKDQLRQGVCTWIGKALVQTKLKPKELGLKLAHEKISPKDIKDIPIDQAKNEMIKLTQKIKLPISSGELQRNSAPLIMVNRNNDDKANALANIIQINSTKHLKGSISKIEKKHGPTKKFAHNISGLGAPQKTLQALQAGTEIIAYDFFEEVLSHNLNIKRALIDSSWLYQLCAYTKSFIYTEEDSVRHLDAYRNAHQVLVNHFLIEELARLAGIAPEQFSIGHGFDLPQDFEDGFLLELSRACLIREIFPRNLTIYLPPKNADHLNLATFLIAAMISEQSAFLTPEAKKSAELIIAAQNIVKNTRSLGEEIQFTQHAKIARRSHVILENTVKALRKIEYTGFYKTLDLREDQGTGLEGIFQKDRHYFNPVGDLLKGKQLKTSHLTKSRKSMVNKTQQKTKKHSTSKKKHLIKKRFKRKKKCQESESS